MSKREIREVYTALSEVLTSKEFLEEAGLEKEIIQLVLNRDYWEAQLGQLVPVKKRYTCRQIYEVCRGTMYLLGREPEEGWMSFAYKYVCHILYPEDWFAELSVQFRAGAVYFLTVLRFFFDLEREHVAFDPLVDFDFLSQEEAEKFEMAEEYERFRYYWHKEFIYEMMRLNAEVTKFNTLEHIAGVHYVSMVIARGLYAAGAPIDLTLASGSAAGHDLGKFGCRPNENVPYMHYYYTDVWFNAHQMPYIGHIAANHSTWDLEPENLSVESLVLIYADFRVKGFRDSEGYEHTRIQTLADAFDVILSKLYNVDEAKHRRYCFVYAKLSDFEDYMHALGVDIGLDGHPDKPLELPPVTLRDPAEVLTSFRHMAIGHNIDVMHSMTAERQFGNLLEAARSEKDWKNVRAYLNILKEYFTYTNDAQKEQTLSFLYELFMHRDGEIRIQSAEIQGCVIARFNAGYHKRRPEGMADYAREKMLELWKHYIGIIIRPDHKLADIQQRRIRSQIKNILGSIVRYAEAEDLPLFISTLLEWYKDPAAVSAAETFVLLNTVEVMPYDRMEEEDLACVVRFALANLNSNVREVSTAAWRSLKQITTYRSDFSFCEDILKAAEAYDAAGDVMMVFLKYRVLSNLGSSQVEALKEELYRPGVVSDISLENFKSSTPWICMAVNIKLLADQVENGRKEECLHIAAHLSNMIKVGQFMLVRSTAGEALIRILPKLSTDQRNEIAVEMLRGLETGETDYSRSIPLWLGQLALFLPPEQLDEIILSLHGLLASPNDHVTSVALDTVGVMLEHYPAYAERFNENSETCMKRMHRMVGMLLTGMANYRERVRQEALLVIGQSVFGSEILPRSEKKHIFSLASRKILFQMTEQNGGELTHFYRAATLSNLYRFLTEYRLTEGEITSQQRSKVAFFPGSFDPFTLSHKEIAKSIRDLGYEVYLSVDEFSWSKKMQPSLIRRQIVNMSVADEFHISLFPADISVNPGNRDDIRNLKKLFEGREVYMVVGSDVIAHASFYQAGSRNKELLAMNHIAFRRVGSAEADSKKNRKMMQQITGELVELELPAELEEISSTRIRENIDMNRDISNYIDPIAQEFIYNNSLYLREPEYKPIIKARAISFEVVEHPTADTLAEIEKELLGAYENREEVLTSIINSEDQLLLLRNGAENGRLVGAARFRYLSPKDLFVILKDIKVTDMVRQRTSADLLMLSGIYTAEDTEIYDAAQLLTTEAIFRSFEHRCDTAIFYLADGWCPEHVASAIVRLGFVPMPGMSPEVPVYVVDMHAPILLIENMETTLKDPFAGNERVLAAIRKAQIDLQHSMTKLYPGSLVLAISASVLYHRLVDKIVAANGVPREVQVPRKLGEMMCVPFGKILRGSVVPNTVTKTLHTDKVYDPDLEACAVEAFRNYSPLPTQIRMIKSFNRPVILVDDVLNRSGIRFNTLEPMLRKENVKIGKVLLGVLTGYGRDVLSSMNIEAESVYYVPNMRYWFMESSLYPFIGGDTVRRDSVKVAGLLPSINLIRPYTNPPLSGSSEEAVNEFSATCIRNARDIMLVLEQEYRNVFARNLTLSRLSEAVNLPLCPDKGDCVNYDPNLAASVYLENDLQQLYRMKVDTRLTHNRYTWK